MSFVRFFSTCFMLCLVVSLSYSQVNIIEFNYDQEGPWTDVENTTLEVQKVPNGSVVVDGNVNAAEYAGMEAIEISPENGYVLMWPGDREWEGPADSAFEFSIVHDDEFVYFGITATDDVLFVDNPGHIVWQDDSIEFRFDVSGLGFDVNYDSVRSRYGGVCKVTGLGRFTEWDEENNSMLVGESRFATAFEEGGMEPFVLAEDGDVWSAGSQTDTTWAVELKLHKKLLEDPELDNPLEDGNFIRFNIGINDDDGKGSAGTDGAGLRERDMEVQYHWSNRYRPQGWNEQVMTEFEFTRQEIQDGTYLDFFDLIINGDGRLAPAGWGMLIFSSEVTPVHEWVLY